MLLMWNRGLPQAGGRDVFEKSMQKMSGLKQRYRLFEAWENSNDKKNKKKKMEKKRKWNNAADDNKSVQESKTEKTDKKKEEEMPKSKSLTKGSPLKTDSTSALWAQEVVEVPPSAKGKEPLMTGINISDTSRRSEEDMMASRFTTSSNEESRPYAIRSSNSVPRDQTPLTLQPRTAEPANQTQDWSFVIDPELLRIFTKNY